MVRWDSPLFTIAWDDEIFPEEDIFKAVTKGDVKPANAGTRAVRLVPIILVIKLTTHQVARAPTDALQVLETTTTTFVSLILSEQASSGGFGGPINLTLPSTRVQLELPSRNVSLSELQRLKRAFVATHKKAITQGATEQGAVDFTEESVAEKFGEYLEQNLKS